MSARCSPSFALLLFLLTALFAALDTAVAAHPRSIRLLDGQWLFQTNGTAADRWKAVSVPSDFQSHEGNDFHGIGWYRKTVSHLRVPEGQRLFLQFQAAATEAEVCWNGQRLGSHLGGWTPFRFDVTDLVRRAPPGATNEIRVRLDEKVGHNTQGFLPVIQPHYGGLWQSVTLTTVPGTFMDDLALLAIGNPKTSHLELQIPLRGSGAERVGEITVRHRLRGQSRWTSTCLSLAPSTLSTAADSAGVPSLRREGPVLLADIPLTNPRLWSPATPNLYEVEVELPPGPQLEPGDCVRTRAAFRSIEALGDELRLNGQPLNVRGVLNWGYYPPRLAPLSGEATFRHDLEFARARGFNLMKFCLWVPPKRFLELADELGMLTWMEYPTWHPQLTPMHLENLQREFHEFFANDRNHPSVILRSLTCETGPGADLRVMQSLYDDAHRMIPGAVIEDDSSWISWNRVSDFYDDHPYGNNHTWVRALADLREYARTNQLGRKPLMLGEAMAADTWVPRKPYLQLARSPRPYWFPGPFDQQEQWRERLHGAAGAGGLAGLESDSLRYGMLMRKYQAEAFRREIPHGGYVVSVLRDIPTASMGLLNYRGESKWPASAWDWQRDTVCLLKTPQDRRGFVAGELPAAEILVSHFGAMPISAGRLEVQIVNANRPRHSLYRREFENLHCEIGSLSEVGEIAWRLPQSETPQNLVIQTRLKTALGTFKNEWPIWVVPARDHTATAGQSVVAHSSLAPEMARELFPGAKPLTQSSGDSVIVASHFDDELVRVLENGGRVLMLPDGQRGSFPLSAHWFLRGAPVVADHPVTRIIPRNLLVDLQHFDLASEVIPQINYLESIDPILLLWDTHDLRTVKTHGLIFETRVGRGRLLVSAVNHRDDTNAAGRWLMEALLHHLATGLAPRRALSGAEWTRLKEKLHEEKIRLAERPWRFRPDPDNEGLKLGWQLPDFTPDATWTNLNINTFWESQGFPNLDGWAWYRIAVEVPKSWKGRPVFLSFEGADDAYELYVNGQLAGQGGDIPTRRTAFDERKSHDLTARVKAGETCVIAVRIFDWYGAGGLFRPVTLSTAPLRPEGEMIR